MKEHIYLGGGGNEIDSAPFDNRFVEGIMERGLDKVIYIPAALRPEKYEVAAEWFRGIFESKISEIEVYTDLSSLTYDQLNNASVYIGGGNTVRLLTKLRETGFDAKLVQYVQEGGVVYGGSAGAIILGKDIRTSPEAWKDEKTEYQGLNLLNGYSVACHYDKTEESKLKLLRISKLIESPVMAITEKGGIIIHNNQIEIIGDEASILYRDEEQILHSTGNTPFALPSYV